MIKAAIIELAVALVFCAGPAAIAGSQQNGSKPQDPIEKVLATGTDKVPASVKADAETPEPPPSLQRRNPRYKVETGDVISLEFPFTPEFNQTVTVQPDGFITLQNVGDLHVDDQTVPQIRTEVESAYSKVLKKPVISITLKQFVTPYFLALGQVTKPGKYDLRGVTTVAEAVTMAGGFTPKAKGSDVLLFRRVSDNWVSVKKVNLKHMLRSGNLSEDLQLEPGDMIYVPQNTLSKIRPYIPYPSVGMMLYK